MEKVVDIGKLIELCDGDTDFMKEIVATMREDLLERLGLLETSFSKKDYIELKNVSHRIKGQALTLMARNLSDTSSAVELSAMNKACSEEEYKALVSCAKDFGRF